MSQERERERLSDQGLILREQRYLQDGRRLKTGIRSESERQEEDPKGAASASSECKSRWASERCGRRERSGRPQARG